MFQKNSLISFIKELRLNNKKTFYKKTLFHKDIIFSPFFIDGVFYCFNWKSYNTNKSEIVLVTRNEDEFFGEFVREEKFYSNNENKAPISQIRMELDKPC